MLGQATASLLLYAFIVVNASLIIVKRKADEPKGSFEVPAIVPWCGAIICAFLIYNAEARSMRIAMLLLVTITILFMISRPKQIDEETISAVEEEA